MFGGKHLRIEKIEKSVPKHWLKAYTYESFVCFYVIVFSIFNAIQATYYVSECNKLTQSN